MAYRSAYIVLADYTAYKGKTIPAEDFDRIALRASDELDQMTFHRVRRAGLISFSVDDQDAIKTAVCALAEGVYLEDQATDGTGVMQLSTSIGGAYSGTVSLKSIDDIRTVARNAAVNYLLFTGLVYSGGGRI